MDKLEGPDQAYCWIIAFSACIINTFLSGISRATGIFYVALIDVYGTSRYEASMPFTLRNCLRNLAGPVVGILGHRYGVRIVTIIGSIFATIGIVLCSVAPNVLWISIFWGIFHGTGVALANTLFPVTVNQYFIKYRTTAAGIAFSGACIGSMIFPVTLEVFLDSYGLQGAFLLTGGLMMQIIPASMLLKEPPWLRIPTKNQTRLKAASSVKNLRNSMESTSAGHDGKCLLVYSQTARHKESYTTNSAETLKNKLLIFKGNDMEDSPIDVVEQTTKSVTYKQSDPNINENSNDQDSELILLAKRNQTISTGKLCAEVSAKTKRHKLVIQNHTIFHTVLTVYKNPMFHLISISFATFGLLFDPFMNVIVDYIKDKGLDDHLGKYLISLLSLGDLVGRLCFGWVTDRSLISVPKFMMLIQLMQGICFGLLPFFSSFEMLMCLIVLYGVASGANIVLFPILFAKYLTAMQSIAMGCGGFFAGLINFTVPSLIGHFRDGEGSYDGMFLITGSISIVTGLLWLLEPCLSRHISKHSSPVENSTEPR